MCDKMQLCCQIIVSSSHGLDINSNETFAIVFHIWIGVSKAIYRIRCQSTDWKIHLIDSMRNDFSTIVRVTNEFRWIDWICFWAIFQCFFCRCNWNIPRKFFLYQIPIVSWHMSGEFALIHLDLFFFKFFLNFFR